MNFMLGESFRQHLDNNRYLDVSYFDNKWSTTVSMSLWEEGNGLALASCDRKYFKYEKFISRDLTRKILTRKLNKQSQKVAGFDLVSDI